MLVVLADAPEHAILGSALFALGMGFVLLAIGSSRLSDQSQAWALRPGIATAVMGLAPWALAPSDHSLTLAGWVWPALLLVLVGWSYRGARRALHNWSRRALLYPPLLVLLLIAAGGAFQTVSAATSSNPAPDRSYFVNGHTLYLHCVGTGEPAVVLFNGLGERTPSWAWVQQRVSSTTRVCAFDRAGEGWSGAAPARQDGHQLASDLHQLLRVARVQGPYVLAGHSVGGVYALVYAQQYPSEVAGVALIDSATPYQFDLPDYPGFYTMGRRLYSVPPVLAHAGLARLTAASSFASLPDAARRQARAFASSPRELRADHADFAGVAHRLRAGKRTKEPQRKAARRVDRKASARSADGSRHRRGSPGSRRRAPSSRQWATHAALLEDNGLASITSRAISNVVELARSGQR